MYCFMNGRHPIIANRTAFLVIGCLEAAWAPLVPFVKDAFSLDEATLGLLMLCTGIGSIAALPIAGWLCVRFGAKRVVYCSTFFMTFSLLAIGMMANLWLTAAMLVIFGGCTIAIDVSANVNGVAVEGQTGRHLMSGFHGGYSLGTLLGAGVMSVLMACGIVPLWSVVVCMALVLVMMLAGCRDLLPAASFKEDKRPDQLPTRKSGIPPKVLVVGMLCFIMYASEGAVMGWSAIFVSEERGVDMSAAGFFYTAFAVAMTTMRLLGDRIVDRFGQRTVVSSGAVLIAMGFLAVVMIDSASAAAVGFALVGVGAANVVPQLVSFAAHIKGMAVHNIISIINALGYSGVLIGPVIIGFVAKRYGLHTSFAGIAVCALVVSLVSYTLLKRSSKQLDAVGAGITGGGEAI